MEHSEYLGETLREIAFEKASIHRPGVPIIALDNEDATVREVIESIAGPDLTWWTSQGETSWEGYASMVKEAATILEWSTSSAECVWPGRPPKFGSDWVEGIITRISAAHNAESLAADLSEVDRPSVLLLGMTTKSDINETLSPLANQLKANPIFQGLVLTQPITGRNPAVSIEDLNYTLSGFGVEPEAVHENPIEAFSVASELAIDGCFDLMIIGSVYLVGDLFRHMIESNECDLWEALTAH